MGSDLVDLRTGRSRVGPGGSKVVFNALILSATKALCLLFGVGRADKDCDLVRITGATDGSAPNCDNLVSMDGKPSNIGETRGRDGPMFDDGTRLRNGGTLGTDDEGSFCFVTIVNPRSRLATRPVAAGSFKMTVGK